MSGRVLEVGAGNGMNFRHYPSTVEQVVAVEPEDILRSLAERAAATAPVPTKVVAGHGDALPFEDAASTPRSSRWCCVRCPTRPLSRRSATRPQTRRAIAVLRTCPLRQSADRWLSRHDH